MRRRFIKFCLAGLKRKCAAVTCALSLATAAAPAMAQYGLKALENRVETVEKPDAAARAKENERARPASRRYHRWLAKRLAQEATPRSLALAALLEMDAVGESDTRFSSGGDEERARAQRWREDARARSGSDVLVLQLTLPIDRVDKAEFEAIIARMRALDRKNLAHWMYRPDDETMAASIDVPSNALPRESFFAIARDAERFDLYYDDILREVVQAVRRHPPTKSIRSALFTSEYPSLDAYAYGLGTALWASSTVPRFLPLVRACQGELLRSTPERGADCRVVAALLRDHSDTAIGHLFGIAIARRAAADDADRQRAKNDRKVYDWRMARYLEALERNPEVFAVLVERLLKSTDISEMSMMHIVIESAGLPMNPPPCWDSGYRFPDEIEASAAQP